VDDPVSTNNYLVSMTAVGSVADAAKRAGNCDQSKWIDALTVPAFVLPKSTQKTSLAIRRERRGIGGRSPLAFVTPLKVNTDGTRISYKVDDPRAKNGAINGAARTPRTAASVT
jgi:hypothetical protein